MQIECLRFGSSQRENLLVCTDGYDLSAADGYGLSNGVLGVDGQNFSVDQDQVGRLGVSRKATQQAGEGKGVLEHESEFTLTQSEPSSDRDRVGRFSSAPTSRKKREIGAPPMGFPIVYFASNTFTKRVEAVDGLRPSSSAHVRWCEHGAPGQIYLVLRSHARRSRIAPFAREGSTTLPRWVITMVP